MPEKIQPGGLYRVFASDGTLLKMGISQRPHRKLALFKREQSSWCPRNATMRVEQYLTRQAAYEALLQALKTERPMQPTYNYGPGMLRRRQTEEQSS